MFVDPVADFDKSLGYNLPLSTWNFFIIIKPLHGETTISTKNRLKIKLTFHTEAQVDWCKKPWHHVPSYDIASIHHFWAQVRAASKNQIQPAARNPNSTIPTPSPKRKAYDLPQSHSHTLGTSTCWYRSLCHLLSYSKSRGSEKAPAKVANYRLCSEDSLSPRCISHMWVPFTLTK